MRIVFEKVPDSEGSSFGCFHAGGRVFADVAEEKVTFAATVPA